jgi:hypothetical protein
MPFEDDEVRVKSTPAATSNNDFDIDDCAVDFGDQDALSRSGLDRIVPADKKSYVRCAVLTDVVKPRMAWMHFIQNGDKKSPYRCLSVRDKKHNIITKGACCAKLENDKDQSAQLVFAVLGLKYINADPATGKYTKDAAGEFPPVRWELGWLRLSQHGFRSIGELAQEEDAPHLFDIAIRNKEGGVGYVYLRSAGDINLEWEILTSVMGVAPSRWACNFVAAL